MSGNPSRVASVLAAHAPKARGRVARPGMEIKLEPARLVLDGAEAHALVTTWRRYRQGERPALVDRCSFVAGGKLPARDLDEPAFDLAIAERRLLLIQRQGPHVAPDVPGVERCRRLERQDPAWIIHTAEGKTSPLHMNSFPGNNA